MCGIVGIYSPSSPVDPARLAAAVATLHHRGPDGQRTWVAPGRELGLGHARLSIIDLNTGDQPLTNEDGSVVAVVNGELYGFEAIRRELEAAGHRFKTQSDSEILLHLYETYGTQCVHRLRGEFAFLLWDARNRTLIAGRDRFGIKPLFVAPRGDGLVFASEVKALFAAGVPAHWDEEVVFQFHSAGLVPPTRSFYRGVEQVPPGHLLIATPGARRLVKYWDFDYPRAGDPGLLTDPEEAVTAFRAKFAEAVRLRLRADVPVGCYLSGGLDSCSILGTASRLADRPVHAFTLSFEAGQYDESRVAEEMAAAAGAPFFPLSVRPRDLADNFADTVWHGELPLLNAHAVAKFLLSRFVRANGYKVVLTGEGSDEIFGGYVHFRRDWLLHNSEVVEPAVRARLLEEMDRNNAVSRRMMGSGAIDDEALPQVRALLGFVPAFLAAGTFGGDKGRVLSPAFVERFAGYDALKTFFNEVDVRGQLAGREPVNQSLYLWSKTALPTYLLTVLGDRMEMSHSVEGRLPFLDHEVVQLVTRLPVSEKIKAMREKHLLREAARPVITDTVYRREKHPFLAPPAASSPDKALVEFVRDTLQSRAFADVPFYDQRRVLAVLEEARSGTSETQATLDGTLLMMVSFAILQQRLGIT